MCIQMKYTHTAVFLLTRFMEMIMVNLQIKVTIKPTEKQIKCLV